MHRQTVRSIFVILGFFIISLLLTACGEAADTSGLSGSYVLKNVEEDEITLSKGYVEQIGLTIRLDPGGTGVVLNGDSEGTLRWKMEEDRLFITIGSIQMSGYPDGSDLLLQPDDSSAMLRFTPEKAALSEDVDSEPAGEADIVPEIWSGNWYGWWKIEQSEGTFPVTWYDCCGSFTQQRDGCLRFIVWDEDGSRSEPLADILFEETDDSRFSSLSGYFLYDAISVGEWILPPPGKDLMLENCSHDADGETFSFTIYLRPWGAKWNDLSEEQLPFYYDDWYLDLIRKNRPMPDRIPWQELETKRETTAD
jgi:hypothetical protein